MDAKGNGKSIEHLCPVHPEVFAKISYSTPARIVFECPAEGGHQFQIIKKDYEDSFKENPERRMTYELD